MKNQDALIIIPTYNERDNIALIIPRVQAVVPGVSILVVDDNSPDGTSALVKEMARERPEVYVLDRSRKEGLGKAYIAGFKWALERSYQYIFEMDADFSHNPDYLPDFLKTIEQFDLVIGSRYISGVNVVNWPMSRLLISYFGNWYARKVTGLPVRDCTAGFKCFRRAVLEAIDLDKVGAAGYSFQIEMNIRTWKKHFRIKEIPIIFTDRTRGESKMSTKIFSEGVLLPWKLRFSTLFRG